MGATSQEKVKSEPKKLKKRDTTLASDPYANGFYDLHHQIEGFEFKRFKAITITGSIGGGLYMFYPLFEGGVHGYAQAVTSSRDTFTLVFIQLSFLLFGAFIGGFLALISKQTRLWSAFVMGLSFPSIMTSVVPKDVNVAEKQKEEGLVPSQPTESLRPYLEGSLHPESPSNIMFSLESVAYANPGCPQTHSTDWERLRLFLEIPCMSTGELTVEMKHFINKSALPSHAKTLGTSLEKSPAKVLTLEVLGGSVQGLKAQVTYAGQQVSNYKLVDGRAIIPFNGPVTSILIFGNKSVQNSRVNVPGNATKVVLNLTTHVTKALLGAIGRTDSKDLFIPESWVINGAKINP